MKRILFVCSQNKLRSPTAEAIFANHPGIEVDSAGLNHDAISPLSPEQIAWADLILVMERSHLTRLNRKFRSHLRGKQVAVLAIPDRYEYMEGELIALLMQKCARYIPSVVSPGRTG
jgi:predicted protein tyrosine phosphatase